MREDEPKGKPSEYYEVRNLIEDLVFEFEAGRIPGSYRGFADAVVQTVFGQYSVSKLLA